MIQSCLKTIGILMMLALLSLTASCGGGSSGGGDSSAIDSVTGIPSAAAVSAVSAN